MQKITKKMIREGLKNGLITIIDDDGDSGCVGIACKISDYAFYFADPEAESMTLDEYLKEYSRNEIVDQIVDDINEEGGLITEFPNEYAFYYSYLKERLEACA